MNENPNTGKHIKWIVMAIVLVFAVLIIIYILNREAINKETDAFLYGKSMQVTIENPAEGMYLLTYPSGYERRVKASEKNRAEKLEGKSLEEVCEYLTGVPDVIKDGSAYLFFYHDSVVDVTKGLKGIGFAEVTIKDGIIPSYFMIELIENENFAISSNHRGFDAR